VKQNLDEFVPGSKLNASSALAKYGDKSFALGGEMNATVDNTRSTSVFGN